MYLIQRINLHLLRLQTKASKNLKKKKKSRLGGPGKENGSPNLLVFESHGVHWSWCFREGWNPLRDSGHGRWAEGWLIPKPGLEPCLHIPLMKSNMMTVKQIASLPQAKKAGTCFPEGRPSCIGLLGLVPYSKAGFGSVSYILCTSFHEFLKRQQSSVSHCRKKCCCEA